ncbi:hypothetical protein FQA39_LY16045 [Lamprigera yunnana]|nr:hypothetical protein FQA39_LY16045 [Lamprigera yunnana]
MSRNMIGLGPPQLHRANSDVFGCKINGCDTDLTEYKPAWWQNTIPSDDGNPSKCTKYGRIGNNTGTNCDIIDFDKNITEKCESYIYETSDVSILHDCHNILGSSGLKTVISLLLNYFNLQCDSNIWKLTLVGTLNGVGLVVGQPIAGVLADRYGRKIILIVFTCLNGVSGIIRSFTNTYASFLVMEIADAFLRSAAYTLCNVLSLELVVPRKRPVVALIINIAFAVGGVVDGGVAWLLQSWRPLLQVLYAVLLLTVFQYWLIPESARWLLAKNRISEAKQILEKTAKVNGKIISESSLKKLGDDDKSNKEITKSSPREMLRSVKLNIRLANCSACWLAAYIVYKGLTINSVSLSENSYLDYILGTLIEIPANILVFLIMDRIGRKITFSASFILSGILCISLIFVPSDTRWLRLTLNLLAKFAISISISLSYVYTSEMFPTPFRGFLLSFSSMFGRIGSVLAPQMPLLETFWEHMPSTIFGSVSLLAGLLSLLLPETMGSKLPNTVEEAENIDRCNIQGCDAETTEFNPAWLINAVPFKDGNPLKCSKYQRINRTSIQCTSADFNKSILEGCDSFIYETPDISILHDFNLQCDENIWKLTLVGTVGALSSLLGQLFFGLLADRFGRKIVLICIMVLTGIAGLIRSFTNTYSFFITMEAVDAFFRTASFNICVILCLELVVYNKRSFVTLLINTAFSFGGIVEGGLAWILQSWRPLIQILYALPLLTVFYYWLIPESIRWLLSAKKDLEAKKILEKLAKINGKHFSEDYLKILSLTEEDVNTQSIKKFLSSVKLVLRLANSSICWLCCIFVYKGLTINAVALSSNSYLDFMLSILVEVPANVFGFLLMDRIGRKLTLSVGFIFSAIFCVCSIFIPLDLGWLQKTIYLLGKFAISLNVAVMCTHVSEMFPTPFRSLAVSISFTFGRVGGLIAPQLPLLESIWKPLPLTLFGSASLLAGFLSVLLPETKGARLPNTIKEAEAIENHIRKINNDLKK